MQPAPSQALVHHSAGPADGRPKNNLPPQHPACGRTAARGRLGWYAWWHLPAVRVSPVPAGRCL